MPRNDMLAALPSRLPKTDQEWQFFLKSLSNLDIRSGATGFNEGTGYFLGFANGVPVFFVGTGGGANFRYDGTNLYLDKGALIVDGNEASSLAYGIQTGSATDGATITFDPVFSGVPAIIFGDGGITYSATLGAVDTQRILQALNLTASGFTMKAKLADLGAPTARSFNFSGVYAASDTATKALAAEAYDDAYTANFTMRIAGRDPDSGASCTATANVYTRPAAGVFTLRATITRTNTGLVSQDFPISQVVVVDGLGLNAEVKVEITDNLLGDSTVAGSTVTYSENTVTEVSATPSGSTPISWLAIGGT
jgi:hypothetical protein